MEPSGPRPMSLFGEPAAAPAPGRQADAPLAARVRPRTLEDVVGLDGLVGPGTPLRRAVESGRLPSLVLWGPPGSGKTTLARVLAAATGAEVAQLSAVESGVAELRGILAAARARQARGGRTVLFVDELHRWSKSQQDAVLPHVESGLVTMIGATTENPSFEVNSALLSRCQVVRLHALADADIARLIRRALADGERGLGQHGLELAPEAEAHLLEVAGGDARVALNLLESAAAAATGAGADRIDAALVRAILARSVLRHDRRGDAHYDTISAMIKSVRGSDPDAAVFWLARLLEAGEDVVFVARRLVILAAEDIGLADPQALVVAVAAWQAAQFVGLPEARLPLAEAAIYLALAPKSNSALAAYDRAAAALAAHPAVEVPLHLRNAVTGLMRSEGYGAGYRYAHDHPDGVAPQEHLPGDLAGERFYRPGPRGAEAALAQRLEEIRRRQAQQPPP